MARRALVIDLEQAGATAVLAKNGFDVEACASVEAAFDAERPDVMVVNANAMKRVPASVMDKLCAAMKPAKLVVMPTDYVAADLLKACG